MREFPNDGNVFRIHSPTVAPAPPPPLPVIGGSAPAADRHRVDMSDLVASSATVRRHRNNTGMASAKPARRSSISCSASDICQRSCSYLDHIFYQLPSSSGALVADAAEVSVARFAAASVRHKNYALWIVTPIFASLSVALVIASLAGPQWLLTDERMFNPLFNGTANVHRPDDGYYFIKHTKSSLWILCTSQDNDVFTTCTTIDYFPQDEYVPDPNDSTMAVPYTYTRSTPFFLVSGVALIISYLVLVVAMCAPRQRNVYFFTSGILFIVSGLVMLVGLIMYISIFKAEIGSKLRPRTPLQSPLFTFQYGHSFCLYVIGFVLTEIVGVMNVFLFIGLQQMRFGEGQDNKSREIPDGASFAKHSMLPNGYYSPMTQRRYFFEKLDNIDMHQSNPYQEYTTSLPPMKHGIPLARSISTATDIYDLNQKNHFDDNTAHRNNHHQAYGTIRSQSNFHLNQAAARMASCRTGSNASILSNSIHNVAGACMPGNAHRSKSKDELFSEFCERAGRRYHMPKEIYFIDSDRENAQAHGYDIRAADYEQIMSKSRRMSMHHVANTPAAAAPAPNSNLYASNSSLHKSYPKNLFELEQRGSLNNACRPKDRTTSVDSRNWRQSNEYSSQTLPRDFLKRNVDFERSLRAEDGERAYNHHVQYANKSNDSLAPNNQSRQSSRQPMGSQDDIVNWPNAIPASPSGFSSRSQFHARPGSLYLSPSVHATPSRQFYNNTAVYEQHQQQQHFKGACKREPPAGQQQRQSPDGDFGTFDLDRIETERRKSHASLFESAIDFENGTAV